MSDSKSIMEIAAELSAAWLSNPSTRISVDEIPALLHLVHDTVVNISSGSDLELDVKAEKNYEPAVSVRKSLSSQDHILSLINGKPYRTLRRHLKTHGLTPDQYRERYNLKHDYPMVAPNYSVSRRDIAKSIGLGRKNE